jgi:nucleotide-binding universal stress UspA family protein
LGWVASNPLADQLKIALVPVTGSSLDAFTVGLACDLVKPNKGVVHIVYIIEIPRLLPLDAELPLESSRGERILVQMEKVAKSRKCKVEGEILQARSLGPAIVGESSLRNADVVVISSPYQEHFGAPTIGEVVPYLLKYSPCRVVVYRDRQPRVENR